MTDSASNGSMDPLEFDLTPAEQLIKIKHTDGTVHQYFMREITGRKRAVYLNGISNRTTRDPKTGKPQGVKTFEGLETSLLALCMYDSAGKEIDPKVVEEWPARVVTALYDRAKELSGLDKDAEKNAKKSTEPEKTASG